MLSAPAVRARATAALASSHSAWVKGMPARSDQALRTALRRASACGCWLTAPLKLMATSCTRVTGPGCTEASGELYGVYVNWCKDNGVQALAKRTLGLRLEERGYRQHKGTGGVRRWQGVKLGHAEGAQSWAA